MAKKLPVIIVGVIVLLLVGGGIWAFVSYGAKGTVDQVESTSDDGAVTLGATFYSEDGEEPGGGVTQALIGGTAWRTHVIFDLSATNVGNVELLDVEPSSPNENMDGAFDNVNPLASLGIGDSNIFIGTTGQDCPGGNPDCDANEDCISAAGDRCAIRLDDYASGTDPHNVDFTISLFGNFINAIGELEGTTSDPVTLAYDIRDETCDDGTTINSCVYLRTGQDSDKPDYCYWIEGSFPEIIEQASDCGCPEGEQQEGETCVPIECDDGTLVGSCSTVSIEGDYGAYMFCNPDQTLTPACNICGCTDDAHGYPEIGCASGSDPSSCTYTTYEGGLEGGIGEG